MSLSSTRYRIFVGVTPGLEPLLQEELRGLAPGVGAGIEEGGLEVSGPPELLWRLAFSSRLAELLRVRLGRPFEATDFETLRARASRLSWAAFLPRGGPMPDVRVTCKESRLYHSEAVADRVREVLAERLGCATGGRGEAGGSAVFVRISRDLVQVSLDAAGQRLHQRGYRTRVSEAPLRETLAAACLAAAGYTGQQPLWDPFCGGGTLCLEGLSLACGLPPGAGRSFAFERWPVHDPAAFAALREGLPAPVQPAHPVLGSDISRRAVEAAMGNAADLAPAGWARFVQGDFEVAAREAPPGSALITNPPYGQRSQLLGGKGGGDLAGTLRRFGRLLRRRDDLDPVVVLAGHPRFEQHTAQAWQELRSFSNRGLPVKLLRLVRG